MNHNTKLLLVLLALFCVGCSQYPLNRPLVDGSPAREYRFHDEPTGSNTNELFICLAFSGGGTRAAALSYGVLKKLRDTKIEWKGEEKSLLDEVDCIASVSGGSFTAAYYGLFGDRIFSDYRRTFLETNVEKALILRAARPDNWFRLASPTYSRIDIAAAFYDKHIFDGATFSELAARERPYIMINATNMANGQQFSFTQTEFNVLGSDISDYPVARAVAASSAFPFLLSPLSLKNYPAPENVKLTQDMQMGLEDFYHNRARYEWAASRADYLNVHTRPYVHLLDGGLSDNVGIRAIEREFVRSGGFIRRLMLNNEIEKLVLVIVNARTQGEDKISARASTPGLLSVGMKTATIAMENYTLESIESIKTRSRLRKQIQDTYADCQNLLIQNCPDAPSLPPLAGEIEPYIIEVDFMALPDEERRHKFLSMPTNFNLTSDQVQSLISVGAELIESDPGFNSLIEDLMQ